MIDQLFKALSEESRLRILSVLMIRPMCVCEIEACLKMTQSNASRHLTVLKNCKILEGYKEAQWAYYRISEQFKEDNQELWEYLQRILKGLKTYQKDMEECEICLTKDICSMTKMNSKRRVKI